MSSRPYPPAIWARFFPVIIVFGLLVILVYLNRRNDSLEDHPSVLLTKDSQDGEKATTEPGHDLNQYTVMTHIGYISLHELNEKVFKAFGYKISKPSLPVPTLEMINEPSCETVFAEWLEISQKPQADAPPKQLPGNLTNEFLMHGYTAISDWYFNDKKGGDAPRNWDKISEYMKFSKSELSALAYSFNKESESVYHAMSGYPLDGMNGFIVGSMQPWVEVMALQHGAKHILTVEYNPLEIPAEFKNRLSSILPVDFVKNWQDYAGTFDFAASFSSIEHSGLGRYGDPVDPIGDLREMLKIKCMLKKGGLLFLGLPYGTDAMQFNAHRIYGSIRIAMMIYGFDWLASYSGESEQPFDLDSRTLHAKPPPNLTQYTLVLRKL